jgi:hypothetical protein
MMKKLGLFALLAVAGCSSSSAPGSGGSMTTNPNDGGETSSSLDSGAVAESATDGSPVEAAADAAELSNFIGGTWSGTGTLNITCGTSTTTSAWPFGATFVAQGPAAITYSWEGCTFDFAVSGDLATLSDAPLACSSPNAGLVYQTFTATSDGVHMNVSVSATEPNGCASTASATATR